MVLRKKIVYSASIDADDDLDLINDDLEEVNIMNTSSSADAHRDVFMQCMERKKQQKQMADDDDVKSEQDVEYICDICHYSFMRKPEELEGDCPHCGAHYVVEDMEELSVIRQDSECLSRQALFEKKAKEQRERRLAILSQVRDNWEDNRKEQISLELGSAEYLEYVDDLKDHNPCKPDDEFHQQLEEHNEDLVTKSYDIDDNPEIDDDDNLSQKDTAAKIIAREEQQKRDIHPDAIKVACASAALTETLADDILAHSITDDNPILYNSSVKPEDYIDALNDYIMDV